jgi:hypothetical protein
MASKLAGGARNSITGCGGDPNADLQLLSGSGSGCGPDAEANGRRPNQRNVEMATASLYPQDPTPIITATDTFGERLVEPDIGQNRARVAVDECQYGRSERHRDPVGVFANAC